MKCNAKSPNTAQWAHTNVWGAGQLIATYSVDTDPAQNVQGVLNFYVDDPLGTRRVMTDYAGNVMEACHSLPYGNGEDCAPTPTEHLFTQHERDAETNNDYFGARYYSSLAGRFLTPDWSAKVEPVPYSKLDDPQTLNLYGYVGNNPLIKSDPDGHDALGEAVSILTTRVSSYLADHPGVGKAASRIAGSFSLKISAGVGVEESVGKNGSKASVALSATGFWQFSKKGVTSGSDLKLGASIETPLTGKHSVGGTTETISKENGVDLPEPGRTENSGETGIGNFTNSDKTFSYGDETGAGPTLGAEVDVDKGEFAGGLNDLKQALKTNIQPPPPPPPAKKE